MNERDGLGNDLVPDYVTSVREGAFYGWPYAYFGANEDPRLRGRRPDLAARAVAPDYALGAHTATMSIVFNQRTTFPARYRDGAFVTQRGSWNRGELAGYRVLSSLSRWEADRSGRGLSHRLPSAGEGRGVRSPGGPGGAAGRIAAGGGRCGRPHLAGECRVRRYGGMAVWRYGGRSHCEAPCAEAIQWMTRGGYLCPEYSP